MAARDPRRRFLAVLLAGALGAACVRLIGTPRSTAPSAGPSNALIAQLWVPQPDITALDLHAGPGGRRLEPEAWSRFRVLGYSRSGYSPTWDLRDSGGQEWGAKGGAEAQTEVVASRLLWALGYHQPPTYHLRRWIRAESGETGPAARFRPKLPDDAVVGRWSWYENPFVGTRPFNRLLALMRLINNWDTQEQNNFIYEGEGARGPGRRYVVRDLGATFGKAKILPVTGTRNHVEDFEEQGFIKSVRSDGRVRFDDLGRWDRRLYSDVRVEDVRWVCAELDRLQGTQWESLFAAAEYEPALARRFIALLKQRIQEGLRAGPEGDGP